MDSKQRLDYDFRPSMLSKIRGTQWTTVARRAFCIYGPLAPHKRSLLQRCIAKKVPAKATGSAPWTQDQITTLTTLKTKALFNIIFCSWLYGAQFMTSSNRVTQVHKASKTFFIRDQFQVFWIRGRNASQTKRCLFCECSFVRPTSSTRPCDLHQKSAGENKQPFSVHNRNTTTTTQWSSASIRKNKQLWN